MVNKPVLFIWACLEGSLALLWPAKKCFKRRLFKYMQRIVAVGDVTS